MKFIDLRPHYVVEDNGPVRYIYLRVGRLACTLLSAGNHKSYGTGCSFL